MDDISQNLERVLGVLETANVKLYLEKCKFMLPEVTYLGYKIDAKGLHPTEEKLRAIKEAPRPTNVAELRAFLGIIKFLPNLSLLYMSCCRRIPGGIGQLTTILLLNPPRMLCKQILSWFTMIVPSS